MMGNPVDGGLRKGPREKRPLLRSRFAQSRRTYCAKGITSKVIRESAARSTRIEDLWFQGFRVDS